MTSPRRSLAPFRNVYADERRADAYATLEYPGTYYLAFRDMPAILAAHVHGRRALDFGCGAGRSTRFLKRLDYEVIGIDISLRMIELARQADPGGRYDLVDNGDFSGLEGERFDLVFSAFAFDNIPGRDHRGELLRSLKGLLRERGRLVLLGSTPEIYTHEWSSFTTAAFPENALAKGGEAVQIVMKDVPDPRPIVDVLFTHADYVDLFEKSGLEIAGEHRPLGRADEPYAWVSECTIAPWVIYVVRDRLEA
jgi:SAM-dependent methyltransferase